jgi:type IV fimbrial biogenesis protein FimT
MRDDKGLTLVELCTVVAVMAVLLTAAVPSVQRWLERQALRGAADELRTDLQFLRAAAVSRGQMLWLGVQNTPSGSCYVIYAGARGDCSCTPAAAACAAGAEALKTVGFEAGGRLQLQSTTGLLGIEPVRGTATPTATFGVITRSGLSVRELVNVMGRVRACSPGGVVPGYKAC